MNSDSEDKLQGPHDNLKRRTAKKVFVLPPSSNNGNRSAHSNLDLQENSFSRINLLYFLNLFIFPCMVNN